MIMRDWVHWQLTGGWVRNGHCSLPMMPPPRHHPYLKFAPPPTSLNKITRSSTGVIVIVRGY